MTVPERGFREVDMSYIERDAASEPDARHGEKVEERVVATGGRSAPP